MEKVIFRIFFIVCFSLSLALSVQGQGRDGDTRAQSMRDASPKAEKQKAETPKAETPKAEKPDNSRVAMAGRMSEKPNGGDGIDKNPKERGDCVHRVGQERDIQENVTRENCDKQIERNKDDWGPLYDGKFVPGGTKACELPKGVTKYRTLPSY